jgi:hypothetical protein
LVEAPVHVQKSFEVAKIRIGEVSPSFVRSIVKKMRPGDFENIPEIAMILLEYCLSDGNYSDMPSVPLLPLANSKFGTFSSKKSSQYYIPYQFPPELLYKIEHLTVDISLLPAKISPILASDAVTKLLNLEILTPSVFCNLLDNILPSSWKSKNLVKWGSNAISMEWLQHFWKYVAKIEMDSIKTWPLLPSQEYLVAMEKNPIVICGVLPQNIRSILKKLACFQIEVEKYQFPIKNPSFSQYTLSATAAGTTTAIFI